MKIGYNKLELSARLNLCNLRENTYPGRGLVVGLNDDGENVVQVYWIMGRSENSRNRVFKSDRDGRLYTEAADPSKVKDPSLIIYNAMRERSRHYVVSNGNQTDTVVDGLDSSDRIDVILQDRGRQYEPDTPNFTQRITAMCTLRDATASAQLSILRKSRVQSGTLQFDCDYNAYRYELGIPRLGFCITTYAGDGDPLPPFVGDPLLMPLEGTIENIADAYWWALYTPNIVSLAVKFIDIHSGQSHIHIINKYEQVD